MAHCVSCYSYAPRDSHTCTLCGHGHAYLRVVADNHHEWNFRYKMIKGKVAETLVEQLFLAHNYAVYRYGMAYTAAAGDSLNSLQQQVAARTRDMPDFVVQHRLYRETYFVEVKFKADGCFSEKELDKNYTQQDALIIVVSARHIKCLSVRELKQGWAITPDCSNHLSGRTEFQLRKDVAEDFCNVAESFFEAEHAMHG